MWSFERVLALAPIFIAALAIAFDVGYFWAIDINLFTLFSLSEHLVFAAQAIPIAVAAFTGSIVAVFLSFWALIGNAEKSRASGEKVGETRSRYFHFFWYVYMAMSCAYFYWMGVNSLLVFNLGFVVLATVVEFVPKSILVGVYLYQRYLIFCFAGLIGFMFIIACGYAIGSSYVALYANARHIVQLKSQAEIAGKVIRSGERGVLLVDGAGAIRFVRMDNVISILKR